MKRITVIGAVSLLVLGLAWVAISQKKPRLPRHALSRAEPCVGHLVASGDLHEYDLFLAEGMFVQGTLLQLGADMKIVVHDPEDRPVLRVDGPNLDVDTEDFWLIAEQTGTYRLALECLFSRHGFYELAVEGWLFPGEDDHIATRAFAAGQKARAVNVADAESYARALELYRQAIALWRVLDNRMEIARAYMELGLFYRNRGSHAEAIEALTSASSYLPPERRYFWESFLHNLRGMSYRHLNDTDKAIDSYRSAFTLALADSLWELAGIIRINQGHFFKLRGQTHDALNMFDDAIHYFQRVGAADKEIWARTHKAAAYSFLGKTQLARDELKPALSLLNEKDDPEQRAYVLVQFGWACYIEERFEEAVTNYRQALALYRSLDNYLGEAGTSDRLATALRSMGKYKQAEDCYRRAMAYFEQASLPVEKAHVETNMAVLLFEIGELETALEYCEKAVRVFEQGDSGQMTMALMVMARIHRQRGDLERARHFYQKTHELIDKTLYEGAETRHLKRSLSDTRHQYREEIIDFLVEYGEEEEAFTVFDQSRARISREKMGHISTTEDAASQKLKRQIDPLATSDPTSPENRKLLEARS